VNLRLLKQLPSILMTSGLCVLFISYLDQHLEAQKALPFKNVSMFLWGLAAITASSVLRAAASAEERGRLIELFRSNVAVLIPLTAVVICSFASAFLPNANLDDGPRYVLYPAYNATVVVLSMLLPLPEHQRKWMRWYLALAFMLSAASVFVDVIRPGTFSILTDRAAGFARNPNTAGFLLVSLCCALITFDRVRSFDLVVLAITTLSVLATLSRGAGMLLALVIACYVPCVVRQSMRRGIGFIMMQIVGLVFLIGITYAGVTRLIDQRMFASRDSRLGMLFGREEVVGPRESRITLLAESWELVREAPILGYGSGYTFSMPQGPHNIYISRWLDNGLAGVISYVWLVIAAGLTFFRRRYTVGLVFTGLVVLEGFFSHNLLDERIFLFLLGVLLTMSTVAAPERASVPQTVRPRFRPVRLFDEGADVHAAPTAFSGTNAQRPQ
jgi:O-antigen ligase